MTYLTNGPTTARHPGLLSRLGQAIVDGLIFLSTIGPKSEALERLSRLSDAQLEARGTTREAEVRRILGPRFYL